MTILPLDNEFGNVEFENIYDIYDAPVIVVDVPSKLFYILIKDLNAELAKYILTGKSNMTEFHVLPEDQEKSIVNYWKGLGLTVTYRSQQIEYMKHTATIVFPQVLDPKSDENVKVSLIPWFMLPGRPFPMFVYIYSICHYHKSGKKSLDESAAAAGTLFGINSFNKSTLSRNNKALEEFFDLSPLDRPLKVEGYETPTDKDTIARVPEMLSNFSSIESLPDAYLEKVKHLPEPINDNNPLPYALSGIADKHLKITKEKVEVANEPSVDKRDRPARPRNKNLQRVQRKFEYVAPWQLDMTRRAFIEICRCLILDAATIFHRFLI
jgi:hypothetical protein